MSEKIQKGISFFDKITSVLMLILGSMHFVLSMVYAKVYSVQEIMYSTGGLAFVFLGLLHWSRAYQPNKVNTFLAGISTLLLLIVMGFIYVTLKDIRVFLMIGVLVYQLYSCLQWLFHEKEHLDTLK